MKHILAIKMDNGVFIFNAAPVPNDFPPLCPVDNKSTLGLKHSGEDYIVYCDKNLTNNELKQLERDWEESNPALLNIVMVKKQ